METEPLVSLIVPIYNVEEYLRECLESICKQSYQNLEIILVNDGSTDGSLAICQEYSLIDKRIKLISKANGGSSSARNAGLKEATGAYFGFADGDDEMDSAFISTLVHALAAFEVEIAVCDYTLRKDRLNHKHFSVEILEKEEAVSRLLDEKGYKCYVWNKLFRRELLSGIQFPEGKRYEDILTTYYLFQKAGKIAYVKKPLYFYRIRNGSFMQSGFGPNSYDLLIAINTLLSEVENIPEIRSDKKRYNRLKIGFVMYYMGFVRRGIVAEADIRRECEVLRSFIKKNEKELFCSHLVGMKKKLGVFLFLYLPNLFIIIVRSVYGKT